MPAIDKLIGEAGWKPDDIGLVAISIGPGSFTGLRIGLSIAKGFAFASGAEIIGVPTLEALALRISKAGLQLPILTVMDARKSEVFAAKFDSNAARITSDLIVKPEAVLRYIETENRIIVAGDGVLRYEELFCSAINNNAARPPRGFDFPHASAVAELGGAMHINGVRHDLESLAPFYVRAPDAVINPPANKALRP